MSGPDLSRHALFAACALALIAAFVLLSGAAGESGKKRAAGRFIVASRLAPSPNLATARAPSGDLRRSSRRFVTAFLAYESGDLKRPIRRMLRSSATNRFASELLAQPPRFAGHRPPPADMRRLRFARLSGEPFLAVISGAARRGIEAEKFSFLFALSGGRWRAAGLGE